MGCIVSCIVDKILVKAANKIKGAMAPFLAILTFFAAIETMVLLFFGIKYGCVEPATGESPDSVATEAEKELAAAKKASNRRLMWAVLCLLVTTLGSIGIALIVLNTDFHGWHGANNAKERLPILLGVAAVRTLVSILVIGALLFGQFHGRDQSLCCCTCILAPLTMCLPLFAGLLIKRDISEYDVEVPDVHAEYPRLLSAADTRAMSASASPFTDNEKK